MERFCDDLRHERERRDVSLETICAITKISPRHLQALEAGDYAGLPGGVFRKGIVRGYLAALGIDEPTWIARFEAALAASGNPVPDSGDLAGFLENVSRSRPPAQPVQTFRWLGVSAMLLAVGLLGWCLWFLVLHGRVVLANLRMI